MQKHPFSVFVLVSFPAVFFRFSTPGYAISPSRCMGKRGFFGKKTGFRGNVLHFPSFRFVKFYEIMGIGAIYPDTKLHFCKNSFIFSLFSLENPDLRQFGDVCLFHVFSEKGSDTLCNYSIQTRFLNFFLRIRRITPAHAGKRCFRFRMIR